MTMLADAPQLKEALTEFSGVCAGIARWRPTTPNLTSASSGPGAGQVGLPFDPTYVDSLILAQNLLPELGISTSWTLWRTHLNLPAFNHHRAVGRCGHGGLYARSLLRE